MATSSSSHQNDEIFNSEDEKEFESSALDFIDFLNQEYLSSIDSQETETDYFKKLYDKIAFSSLYNEETQNEGDDGESSFIEFDPLAAQYKFDPLRRAIMQKRFELSLFLLPAGRTKKVIPIGCNLSFAFVVTQREENGVFNLYCLPYQDLSNKLLSPSQYFALHNTNTGYHTPWVRWTQDIHDFGALSFFENLVLLASDHRGLSDIKIMNMPDFKIKMTTDTTERTHAKTRFAFFNAHFLVVVYERADEHFLFILTAQTPRKYVEIPLSKKYNAFHLTDDNHLFVISDHQIRSYFISFSEETGKFGFEKIDSVIKVATDKIRSVKFYEKILLVICEHRVQLIDINEQESSWIDVGSKIIDISLIDPITKLFVCHDQTNGLYFLDQEGITVCYSNTAICEIFKRFNYPCPSIVTPYNSIVYRRSMDEFNLGYLLPNGSFLRFTFHLQ
jgi:hypothetical protein